MLKCTVKPFDAAMPSVFSVPFCVQCMHIHAHKMRVHGLCCHVLVISRLFSSLQTCLYIIQCINVFWTAPLLQSHTTSSISTCLHVTAQFRSIHVVACLFFVLRVFFGINPERGSKAVMKGKKRSGIPAKVSKLATQLKEFECKQKESEWAI